MRIVPLTLAQANRLVAQWHRHHRPVVRHRFSLGVEADGVLVGAVIVCYTTARLSNDGRTVEVTRLVTDGYPNACSMLYQAAARVAREMGFDRIQTFILAREPGTSLKAAGWTREGQNGGGTWRPERRDGQATLFGRDATHPIEPKVRWARRLNPPARERVAGELLG